MKTQQVIKRIIILVSGFIFMSSYAQTQEPYSGTPLLLPGTIEAENYDLGGQSVAYYDVTTANIGGQYRTDLVDIENCVNGGYNIHKIEVYEWLEYTVNVTESGSYKFDFHIASTKSTSTITMTVDGNSYGTVNVPNTGGMQTWRTVKRSVGGLGIGLSAGIHVLRLSFSGVPENNGLYDMLNLDKIVVAKETQFAFIPLSIPGVIEAEHFDIGGFNNGPLAYNDFTSGNAGGVKRSIGKIVLNENVDMEACSEGGTNVGWIQNGEWLEYTVNVMQEGIYSVDARVASNTSSGSMQLLLDGNTLTNVIAVPYTGGWQNWQTITQTGLYITSGTHVIRVKMTGNEFNLNKMTFTKNTVAGCTGTFASDYSYVVSTASTNPTITFNPILAGVGSSLVILYYGTGSGVYPGFVVTPGVPYQITATPGQNINFYYTYSYPTGGERNSSATPHHVTVGTCGESARTTEDDDSIVSGILTMTLLYPNPMGENNLLYFAEPDKIVSVKVVNAQGGIVLQINHWNTSSPLNLQELNRGVYQVITDFNGEISTSKVIR